MEEDKYEGIELVVKSRSDDKSWFDVIFDMISENCEGTEENECTCGLELMSAIGGTYDQVMDWTNSVGYGIQPIDLAKAIKYLLEGYAGFVSDIPEDVSKAIDWAEKEIAFEADFEKEKDDVD